MDKKHGGKNRTIKHPEYLYPCSFEEATFGINSIVQCPLCGEYLKNGDRIYQIINNSNLFPDITTHADCAEEENFGLIGTIKKLKESWNEAAKYQFWFFPNL